MEKNLSGTFCAKSVHYNNSMPTLGQHNVYLCTCILLPLLELINRLTISLLLSHATAIYTWWILLNVAFLHFVGISRQRHVGSR